MEGDLVVPKTWSSSFNIVQFGNLHNNEARSNAIFTAPNGRFYVEKSTTNSSQAEEIQGASSARERKSQVYKVDTDKTIHMLGAAVKRYRQKNPVDHHETLFSDDLKQVSAALDISESKLESCISTIRELLKKLQLEMRNVEPFLNQMLFQQEGNGKQGALEDRDEKGDASADKRPGTMKGKIDAQESAGSSKQGSSSNTKKKDKGSEN